MSENPHVLVATLGGQPQIVTFTLDLLLERGYPISKVIIVHPSVAAHSRLQRALSRLKAEFTDNSYRAVSWPIQFQSHVLEFEGQPIDDIVDNMHADGTLNTIHRLLGDLKRSGYRIHLSVSGGRRMMALLAISVATLNFDRYDHIWHINTPESIKEQADEGNIMHMPVDAGIKLIEGPFIALGAYIYSPVRSFNTAREEQRSQLEAQERTRCAKVVEQATPAQLKILQALAKGLTPRQVAEELQLSLATVSSHNTFLLSYCREAWEIPARDHLNYLFLRTKFADYFQDEH